MNLSDTDSSADQPESERPTVASMATVASTSDDVEAANPTHPDRPVGVNVDTADIGTAVSDSEDAAAAQGMAADDEEALGAAQTDAAASRDA
ncbi:MAG: hypothetical protein JWP66_1592 [Naasia sp.]|nr:hypothetical protein [Naasia sp.]